MKLSTRLAMCGVHMRLRDAEPSDLDLLRRWDEQPHVHDADPEWDEHWERELARKVDWCEELIFEANEKPVGFVRILDPSQDDTVPAGFWGECPDGLREIDVWIGDAANLSKGYGTRMMELALERCFSDHAVRVARVCPLQSNARARRFYERFGFSFVENRRIGQDDCAVYRLDRARWKEPSR